MNAEKIIDLRFIAPVGIMVFFASVLSPENFVIFFDSFLSENWLFNAVGILGVGIIISSVTHFFVEIFLGEPTGEYENHLSEIFKPQNSFKKTTAAKELAIWILLDEEEKKSGKGVADQIHKRWNVAAANFNAAAAVLGGVVTAIVLMIVTEGDKLFLLPYPRFILYIIFACALFHIFIHNGKKARKSVLDMGDLLAEKYVNQNKDFSS